MPQKQLANIQIDIGPDGLPTGYRVRYHLLTVYKGTTQDAAPEPKDEAVTPAQFDAALAAMGREPTDPARVAELCQGLLAATPDP